MGPRAPPKDLTSRFPKQMVAKGDKLNIDPFGAAFPQRIVLRMSKATPVSTKRRKTPAGGQVSYPTRVRRTLGIPPLMMQGTLVVHISDFRADRVPAPLVLGFSQCDPRTVAYRHSMLL